jgi:hypothetical protein
MSRHLSGPLREGPKLAKERLAYATNQTIIRARRAFGVSSCQLQCVRCEPRRKLAQAALPAVPRPFTGLG